MTQIWWYVFSSTTVFDAFLCHVEQFTEQLSPQIINVFDVWSGYPSVVAKLVFICLQRCDAPIPFPASSSLVCQALYDLKGCADDKMLEKDGQSIPAVHKRIWRPGLQIFHGFFQMLAVSILYIQGQKNIFGHFWLVQTDKKTHGTWIPGTYPCGVPAAGPLREDAIIVGKSKLVRPVSCHRSPLWTPGRWKTTGGISMQKKNWMLPRKLIWWFHERLAKELEKRRYISRKVCKRSWPKHAKTCVIPLESERAFNTAKISWRPLWWFPNSLSLTIKTGQNEALKVMDFDQKIPTQSNTYTLRSNKV